MRLGWVKGGRVGGNSIPAPETQPRVLSNSCLPIPPPSPPQLILADEDMAIDVGSIMVSGALRAGSPDCRLTSRITLTFHPVSGVDIYNMVGPGRRRG